MTARACGSCSLCCKLMDIPELDSPVSSWCRHCRPGHGCQIHPTRPTVCRDYACAWLRGKTDWYPLQTKIIVDAVTVDSGELFMRFTVDPGYSTRWREPPYYQAIKTAARTGLRGWHDQYWRTVVSVDGKWTLVLPDKEVPYGPGRIVKLAPHMWEFAPA